MADTPFDKQVKRALSLIHYPLPSWTAPSSCDYDIVIIGAGMAGLAAAFALKRQGIARLKLFDKSPAGLEGPWATYARMPTLRSTKDLVGPAQDIPELTFQAWYTANQGEEAWEKLGKIPTSLWMEYLRWFKQVLDLPIESGAALKTISPQEKGLALSFDDKQVTTQKLVLATGRAGFGGSTLPGFAKKLPLDRYAHTNDRIDFSALKDQRVGVIGGGASGFDAAWVALQHGVTQADILIRRAQLPHVNKSVCNSYPGFIEGYYDLQDKQKWAIELNVCQEGIPPPFEALERVKPFPNFQVRTSVQIGEVDWKDQTIQLKTNQGIFSYDFLIFATGFAVDGRKQPEIAPFMDHILLWKDRIKDLPGPAWFYNSPYLGRHYQFIEKNPDSAPYLKDIYLFNYAATLSHGLLSSDIPAISAGAQRLARGIASDLFSESYEAYLQRLQDYQVPEFQHDTYPFWN